MHHLDRDRSSLRAGSVAFFVALLTIPLLTAAGGAAKVDAVATGESLYRIYCATCHGQSAKGDGATAVYLTVKPADLTRLSRRNGGKFPAEEVQEIIDGRAAVAGHGDREMPLWGLALQDWAVDRSQEQEVRARIEQLVSYLESIQKK